MVLRTRTMSRLTKLYVIGTVCAGCVTVVAGLTPWHSEDVARFICYFLIAALASGFKVYLPGITGTMSVNFFFVLICITDLSLSETLAVACTGAILQSVWRTKTRPNFVKVLFNIANIAIAVSATFYWYHLSPLIRLGVKPPFMLGLAACVYFVANTAPVAMIVALTERKRLLRVWRECYFWSSGRSPIIWPGPRSLACWR